MNPAQVYTDFSGLAELKARAGRDAEGSLDQVARQFESLLIHQMLKSMRQANLGEGLLDSDQSLFYRDMYDQQLAIHLAESGGFGLAEVIKRQLGAGESVSQTPSKDLATYFNSPITAVEVPTRQQAQAPIAVEDVVPVNPANKLEEDPAGWSHGEFVQKLWPWALEAAKKLGLAPQALLAQAALETGWGKRMMRLVDGSPARNLFGIKADRGWKGDKVSLNSVEYEQGVAVKKKSHFRAYDSFRDSFEDYVQFLRSNPRYRQALEAVSNPQNYFSALQHAGYATDPDYAAKIIRVLHGSVMEQAVEGLKEMEKTPL